MVVRAPAAREPWTVPAAPASDCISTTLTVLPKMFFRPAADHWSTLSAMGLDGGDGVDASDLSKGIADVGGSSIAVHGFEFSSQNEYL